MGGVITNPPPPDEGTQLTPAADVPPESYLPQGTITDATVAIGEAVYNHPLVQAGIAVAKGEGMQAFIAWVLKNIADLLQLFIKYLSPELVGIGNILVKAITPLIADVSDIFGELSKAYVQEVTRHYSLSQDGGIDHKGTPTGNAAKYAFDSIVAPIAMFTSGADPSKLGSGQKNIQQTLGIIVQLHLITWVLNVMSNITGIGQLKFFNSFTEVLLTAISARRLSSFAMRPYINTMITEPATAELNTQWPIKIPSASSAVKDYIRGAITSDKLIAQMKRLGYSPEVTAALLLDTAHLMSVNDVAYLVRVQTWTTDDAVKYLQQLGYDQSAARVVLHRQVNQLVFSLNTRAADAMGSHFASGEIDEGIYRDFLKALGFTDLEVQGYITVYGIDFEFPTKLTYAQVKDLFLEGLVDLDFVRQYLTDKHNKPSDIDLLILLDFTAKDQRDARKAVLGATARVQAVKEKAQAETAAYKGEQLLADALAAQSAAKAALAAKYGK